MLNDNQKGQGLIEMLIAIAIILTAIVGGLSLMISSYNAEQESARRTVAANLGREAIEICRGLRDSAWINRAAFESWFTNADLDYSFAPSFDEAQMKWTLSSVPDAISDAAAGVYQYKTGSLAGMMNNFEAHDAATTLFRRIIFMNPICWNSVTQTESTVEDGSRCTPLETVGVKIRARVEWSERGRTHGVNVEDQLYNWRWR
ncbi:MAG: prepilin-type N-terminal cleavage/methylation domain-containing protein [Patescibacteria group bacterium]|nr:prepilin-type N-terminal cleavage/methylation domain-containing protein [Patescibacteria group bacterium]